jgi:hypothetical protein
MSHPIHLVRRFENRVASGHYREHGDRAAEHYRARPNVDPYERIGQLTSTKKKLSDKLALIRDIVGRAVGVLDLSDDDALSVLVGWAAVEYLKHDQVDPRGHVSIRTQWPVARGQSRAELVTTYEGDEWNIAKED